MRARKVFFKVQGLRPNTRVFPFLDGNNITDFTRSETFKFYSDTDSDFGNTLKNTTAHPDGSTTLTTDANGDISGSFIVPNNDTLKIRVGTKEFKILDISADNEENAGCIGKAPYTATGFLDTKEATYASTRQLNVTGLNIRRRAVYQGDGGNDDDPPPKTTTKVTGSWVTGPEPMSNNKGYHFGFSLSAAEYTGLISLAASGGSIVGDDPDGGDVSGGGHDGTDGGYGGDQGPGGTDYGGT